MKKENAKNTKPKMSGIVQDILKNGKKLGNTEYGKHGIKLFMDKNKLSKERENEIKQMFNNVGDDILRNNFLKFKPEEYIKGYIFSYVRNQVECMIGYVATVESNTEECEILETAGVPTRISLNPTDNPYISILKVKRLSDNKIVNKIVYSDDAREYLSFKAGLVLSL